MKRNLLIILFAILLIWNAILTYNLFNLRNNDGDDNSPVINNYNVSGFSTDFTSIVETEKASVVTIDSFGELSSGFIYKQNGEDVYIITTYHSVAEENNHFVIFDSLYRKEAELIGSDIYSDIAILHTTIPYEVNVSKIGDSELLKEGEFLISIGTPNSIEYRNTIELSMVASSLRFIDNDITYEGENISYFLPLIQLSSNLKEGNSGSPLLNMNGEVVGICLLEDENGTDFALPINEAVIIAEKIINNEEINHHLLGIRGEFISKMANYERNNLSIPIEITEGIYINRIKENSIASNIGLRNGDVVLSINGIHIVGNNDLLNIIFNQNNINTIDVYRNNERITLESTDND